MVYAVVGRTLTAMQGAKKKRKKEEKRESSGEENLAKKG